MKKMVAVVLMLILLAPCAMAEDIDLSGLSFAEQYRQSMDIDVVQDDVQYFKNEDEAI